MTALRQWTTRVLTAAVAALTAGAGLVLAQQGDKAYVPLPPGQLAAQEQLPATPLVFAAYAFVWLALIAYVFFLWRRLTKLERELGDLRSKSRATRA